eukprot:COSAG06_NODE_6637_length_2845_cov_1.736708_3_plen_227_part_00
MEDRCAAAEGCQRSRLLFSRRQVDEAATDTRLASAKHEGGRPLARSRVARGGDTEHWRRAPELKAILARNLSATSVCIGIRTCMHSPACLSLSFYPWLAPVVCTAPPNLYTTPTTARSTSADVGAAVVDCTYRKFHRLCAACRWALLRGSRRACRARSCRKVPFGKTAGRHALGDGVRFQLLLAVLCLGALGRAARAAGHRRLQPRAHLVCRRLQLVLNYRPIMLN